MKHNALKLTLSLLTGLSLCASGASFAWAAEQGQIFGTDNTGGYNGGSYSQLVSNHLTGSTDDYYAYVQTPYGSCASTTASLQLVALYGTDKNYGTSTSWNTSNQNTIGCKYIKNGWMQIGLKQDPLTLTSDTNFYFRQDAHCLGHNNYCNYLISPIDYSVTGDIDNSEANNKTTHIIDMAPINGTTVGNQVNFKLDAYINDDDFNQWGTWIEITLHNIDQNVFLLSQFSPNDIYLFQGYATSSGYFSFATTTTLGDGNYRLEANIHDKGWGAVVDGLRGNLGITESTQFIVNQASFIGNISQNSWNQINTAFSSTSATSTVALSGSCVPWSGDFNTLNCLAFLFIPDSGYLNATIKNFQDNAATRFPIGYITDFIHIMNNASSSLPIIDATVPQGIPGAGAHLSLSLNHVLDYVLYATTSQFTNSSATNTGTLYSITNYYWSIIVYAFTALYLLARIIGSHLIPHIGDHLYKTANKKIR